MKLKDIKPNPQLIVLIGLPGVGKSYIINDIIHNNPQQKYHIASTDNIIDAIAKEQGKTYSDVFQSEFKNANKTMQNNVAEAIANRESVIWDQTNMASGKRRGIIHRFPRDYKKIAVVVTSEPTIHAERLKKRAETEGKHIPQHILDDMASRYEEPSKSEGFDEIKFIENN